LTNAGLRDVDHILAHLGTEPTTLSQAVKDTKALLTAAAEEEGI
jgi:hypothetical protein